jgi:hypothetical protein
MARILNACPVTIELARLAAQVREHAPFCGPERTYTVALRDLGRACDLECSDLMSERLWLAVCCAEVSASGTPGVNQYHPDLLRYERDAIAHLMASPEWHAWIDQRGAATGDDLTPEARAENEWRTSVVIRSDWRSVTRLT